MARTGGAFLGIDNVIASSAGSDVPTGDGAVNAERRRFEIRVNERHRGWSWRWCSRNRRGDDHGIKDLIGSAIAHANVRELHRRGRRIRREHIGEVTEL